MSACVCARCCLWDSCAAFLCVFQRVIKEEVCERRRVEPRVPEHPAGIVGIDGGKGKFAAAENGTGSSEKSIAFVC